MSLRALVQRGANMALRTVKELVEQARATIERLGVEQAAAELAAGALLVDLREEAERVQHGAIPGALAVPRGMLEFAADPTSPYHRKELDPGRRIVLACASGGRSALAAATLQAMGYRNVAHLEGGLKAWKEAGKPVAPVQPAAQPAR